MFWKSWSARILSVLALGAMTVIILPVFMRARESCPSRASCTSNLKQIGLAVLQYALDYDEKLPPVQCQGSAYGWADVIQPYLKSTQLYQCPQQMNVGQTDPRKSGYIDYAFNARIEKALVNRVPNLARQILVFDGHRAEDVTDARYAFSQIPGVWFTDTTSPLYRHSGSANYLFVDGHVKRYLPGQIGFTDPPIF